MSYTFFAAISRMKYIDRWALMRSSRKENLSEHSLEVAMISHALCTIGNVRYGKKLDANKAAVIALYHDASEIMTGDLPTPVKYSNSSIRDAYKDVEYSAEKSLLQKLPEDLQPVYEEVLCPGKVNEHQPQDGHPSQNEHQSQVERGNQDEQGSKEQENEENQYLLRLVKAADKLSALIKCIEERQSGNQEFKSAEESTKKIIDKMADEMPEVADFVRDFLPSYGKTLDELSDQN